MNPSVLPASIDELTGIVYQVHRCLTQARQKLAECRGMLGAADAFGDRLTAREQRDLRRAIHMARDAEARYDRANAEFRLFVLTALARLSASPIFLSGLQRPAANENHRGSASDVQVVTVDVDQREALGSVTAAQKPRNPGGRPAKFPWRDLYVEALRLEYDGEGLQSRDQLQRHMGEVGYGTVVRPARRENDPERGRRDR